MKKFLAVLLTFILVTCSFLGTVQGAVTSLKIKNNGVSMVYTGTQPKVVINGVNLKLPVGVSGIIEEGYALLPAKKTFTKLGATYKYTKSNGKIVIKYNGNTMKMTINKKVAYLNGKKVKLPLVPRKVYFKSNKKTYIFVPSRYISEKLGFDYEWFSSRKTIYINNKKSVQSSTTEKNPTTANTEISTTEILASTEMSTTELEIGTSTELASTEISTTEVLASTEISTTEVLASTEMSTTEILASTELKTETSTELASTEISTTEILASTEMSTTEVLASTEMPADKEIVIEKDCVKIKKASSNITYTTLDNYTDKTFIITIKGDYEDFYSSSIMDNAENVESVSVKLNSLGDTEISIKTSTIKAFVIEETVESLSIFVKNPKEVYEKIIVIDAGHGGVFTGAVGNGLLEKNVTLDIVALYTKKYFDQDDSIKVYYTRVTDTNFYSSNTEDLKARARMANEVDADMFISVHINSHDKLTACGTEVYYYNKEDKVNSFGLKSSTLAKLAQDNLLKALNTVDRGVKQNNYSVLRNSNMTGILCEIAFLSNASDANLLKDSVVLDKVGEAIYKTVSQAYVMYK